MCYFITDHPYGARPYCSLECFKSNLVHHGKLLHLSNSTWESFFIPKGQQKPLTAKKQHKNKQTSNFSLTLNKLK